MISGLQVLNSSYVGSRDLWWVDDPLAILGQGYNIYRAFDYPANWTKLTASPQHGHFFRDLTQLQTITYTVLDVDWVERGQNGKFGFHIPDIPYSGVVKGRPMVANSPDDVTVLLDGTPFRPALVSGADQTVWLRIDETLAQNGAVSSFPIKDPTTVTTFQVIYQKLTNYVDVYNAVRTFYSVVSVGSSGSELYAPGMPGSVVNTQDIDRMDYMQAEMVRRNSWLFEQVGEPAYLLFKKTRGTKCGCTSTGTGGPKSSCPSCFEVGWVGGYFGPYDVLYTPPDSALVTTIEDGSGRKSERQSKAYLGPTPIVQNGDLIVRRNGERLVLANVNYTQNRGVILQQEFDTELLNLKDTRYLIPLQTFPTDQTPPTIYNPITQANPLDGVSTGAEPIVQAGQIPNQNWENSDKQTGRTVTFGKIQS